MSDTLILVWLVALTVAAVALFILHEFRRRAEWKEWRKWVAGDKPAPPAGQQGHGVLFKHMQEVENWIGCANGHLGKDPNWPCKWPGTEITPPPKVPKTP